MSIPELMACVLQSIRNQFYNGAQGSLGGVREFKRDETKLLKAISLFGHLCHQRGWELDAGYVLREIMTLLQSYKRSGVEIDYLPVYLTGSIKRRVGQRAEELQAASKSMRTTTKGQTARERQRAPAIPAARLVNDVMDGKTMVVAVREKSATETLADVYKALRTGKRKKASAPKQEALF
jgi:hypothetical protein